MPREARAHDEYLDSLIGRARAQHLAQRREWQVLLHYRPTAQGALRSQADGAGFFFAGPRGKVDPQAELEATLAAFRRKPPAPDPARIEETQPAQCRFPARWAFLKRALAWDAAQMPDRDCPIFSAWRAAIAPERVTLVFASSFLNSPASLYGHTFLRLYRSTGEGNPLLDYIVNFAADADTSNGLLYAFKGLFGGFRGYFYTMPYYVKIQEYSNIESRDLWEYDLALTQPQAERLVQHVFETRSTHFDYFFMSENCSYFLLALLEVADPRLRLTDAFRAHVIPGDTVLAVLSVPGLVKEVRGRPSLRAELMTRRRGMGRDEVAAAETLAVQGKEAAFGLAALAPERQARTIDAAYDLMRYREGLKSEAQLSEEFRRRERDLLVLRGRTGLPPQPTGALPDVAGPELAHRSFRMGLGGGANRDGDAFGALSLRLAIHDYLDPVSGYAEGALLEMGHLRLRWGQNRLGIERFDLLQIVSAVPLDSWGPKSSWRVRAGVAEARELGCSGWQCLGAGASAGGGAAVGLGRHGLLAAFLESEAAGGGPFQDHYRVGFGGSALAVVRWGRWAQTELTARYVHWLLGDDRRHPAFTAGQAVNVGRRAQLRLTGEAHGRVREARAELYAYF